ncbi:MAG: hypothetical protein SGJ03_07270 [Alphaproteobacteria bacterium]|nr:hypothetical protein [Alphaproteobacteria bacterium]
MTRAISSAIDQCKSRSAFRQALVAVLFFAFVAQAQLAAGHFHFATNAALAQGIASESDGNAPGSPSQAPCQTCQVVSTAQNYLSGGTFALVPPVFTTAGLIDYNCGSFAGQALYFIWRSRAPPAR